MELVTPANCTGPPWALPLWLLTSVSQGNLAWPLLFPLWCWESTLFPPGRAAPTEPGTLHRSHRCRLHSRAVTSSECPLSGLGPFPVGSPTAPPPGVVEEENHKGLLSYLKVASSRDLGPPRVPWRRGCRQTLTTVEPLAAWFPPSLDTFPGDPKATAHLSPWVTERGRRGAGPAGQVGAAGAGRGSKWLGRAQSVLRGAGAGARCAAPSARLRRPPAARPCLCRWCSRAPAARWRGCRADLRPGVLAPPPPPPLRSRRCPRCGRAGPGVLCSLQPGPAAPPPPCWPRRRRSRPAAPPRQAPRCCPRARCCRSGSCSWSWAAAWWRSASGRCRWAARRRWRTRAHSGLAPRWVPRVPLCGAHPRGSVLWTVPSIVFVWPLLGERGP
jgi:hypothetical protein